MNAIFRTYSRASLAWGFLAIFLTQAAIAIEPKNEKLTLPIPDPADFASWKVIHTDNRILYILEGNSAENPGNPAVITEDEGFGGFVFDPEVNTSVSPSQQQAGPSQTSLSVTSTGPQVGFTGWGTDLRFSFSHEVVYRATVLISTTTPLDTIRDSTMSIRFGNALNTGINYVQFDAQKPFFIDGPGRKLPSVTETPAKLDLYTEARRAGDARLEVSLIDFSTASDATANLIISGYEIRSTSRNSLGSGTVLRNIGGPLNDPWAPTDNLEPFTAGGEVVGKSIHVFNGLNPSLFKSLIVTEDALVATHGPEPSPGDGSAHWEFTQFFFHAENPLDVENANTGFVLTPGRLYNLDIWASTNNEEGFHPMLATICTMDQTCHVSNLWWLNDILQEDSEAAISSTPTRYSTFIYPDPDFLNNPTVNATFRVGFLHALELDLARTTITIHRMVLREYDAF